MYRTSEKPYPKMPMDLSGPRRSRCRRQSESLAVNMLCAMMIVATMVVWSMILNVYHTPTSKGGVQNGSIHIVASRG